MANDATQGLPAAFWMTWWLAQMVICIYLGNRTAKKTGRDVINWTVVGFLCSVPPFAGVAIMLVAYFFCPPSVKAGPFPPDDGRRNRQDSGDRGTGSPR